MKKRSFWILGLLICILFVGLFPLSAKADTDADEDTETETETETDPNKITGNFWDSDETTLLYQVVLEKKDGGTYLSEIMESEKPLRPVRRGYALYKWFNADRNNYYTPLSCFSKFLIKKDFNLTAVWDTKPYTYDINYDLDGGAYTVLVETVPKTFTVESETIELPGATKAGYLFDGWYTEEAHKNKMTSIPKGTYYDSDENGDVPSLDLYAKFVSAKPKKVNISSLKNKSNGKATLTFAKVPNAEGYEVLYSQDKAFKKNVHMIDTTKNSVSVTFLPKGKTYYFKVRAYGSDSLKNRVYGDYSARKSCKITKGVTEVNPSSNSGSLKTVSIKNGGLYVKISVPKRLKSSDDFYYLVSIDPVTGKVGRKVGQTEKVKNVVFQLPIKDEKGNTLIEGKYAMAVKQKGSYKVVSKASFIANPEDAATYTAPFPATKSKKGLQGYLESDLNAKHTFLNMDITRVLGGSTPYQYNGKTYYFNEAFSGFISNANRLGMTVTGQVMMSWSDSKSYMIIGSGREPGHPYYSMNAQETKAREELEAAFCFMAEQYSKPDCHVDNWILGNEVNVHKMWYYAGNVSRDEFMKNYADTFRILYYAVKGSYKNARVYICMDHAWSDAEGGWGTKNFINDFDAQIKSQNSKIQWNLAYHAYPQNLLQSATWNDSEATNDENTIYVTPKNLNVMTEYVENRFGKNTRIILSEQGFTSTCGEDIQAAGIAYTFYKAQFNNMIDAVIFRATYDQPAEVAQGLRMGLTTEYGGRKKAYDVFKYMDGPKYEQYTKDCLGTLGISNWGQVAPGFDPKVLKKMK